MTNLEADPALSSETEPDQGEAAPKKSKGPTRAAVRLLRRVAQSAGTAQHIQLTALDANERKVAESLKAALLVEEAPQGAWLSPTDAGRELSRRGTVRVWLFGDPGLRGVRGDALVVPALRSIAGQDRKSVAQAFGDEGPGQTMLSTLQPGELAFMRSNDFDEGKRRLWWLGEVMP